MRPSIPITDPGPPGPQHAEAMAAGARCAECGLRNRQAGPVPPTLPSEGPIPLLLIAEAPGITEVEKGETLIGPSGREVRRALDAGGYRSNLASYTNAILCMPTGGDLEGFLRYAKKRGDASPIDCCRPRLETELQRAQYAILLGGASLKGVNLKTTIMKVRGTPVEIPNGPRAMPTLHPAYVLRDKGRVMRSVFHADIKKGLRLRTGQTTWTDPPYFVVKNAAELSYFLQNSGQSYWAVDTETDAIDPWTCGLRRIGIGSPAGVAIFSPLSVTGQPLMPQSEIDDIKRVFAQFFQSGARFAFHNFYTFDSIVLAQHGMPVPDSAATCSLIGHHLGLTAELPHGLDFLGSIYTDAPYWKDDVKHTNIKDDAVLDRYLSFDVAVTHIAAPQVWQTVELAHHGPIYRLDATLSATGRSMAALGIRLDRQAQWKFANEYQDKADRLRREFVEACGKDVNPRSPPQLVKFLYDELGLPILEDRLTKAGEPSTAEPVLLELLSTGISARGEKIIKTLLGFREADKILGTYTGRIEKTEGDRIIEPRLVDGPPVHPDGRLRVTWKVYGTVSGRWSSGDPMNLQNIPKKLRAMFIPEPGNVFVAADFSALELRIQALLAEDPILIEAFRAFDAKIGPDIHVVNTCTIFSCDPTEVTEEPRTFAKRFVYGLTYGAGPPKIFQTLSLLRDDDLKPVFPGITLSEVERVYKIWWGAHPKIAEWQKDLIRGWRRRGYIATPWHGRRRYFLGGENHEEMKNFPIQGGAADLQNQAVLALTEAYPFDFGRRIGLVLQVHDQLVVECPEGEAERVKQILSWAMVRKIGPMLFPAEVKIGKTWKEVS